MDKRFTRKNIRKPNSNKKPELKNMSGGHSSTEKFPITVSGVWTEDMSIQIRKENSFLQREQERKRKTAIDAMKLVEQRKARAKEDEENVGQVVFKEKKPEQNATRRALFTLDSNQVNKNKNFQLKDVCKLPVVKENEHGDVPVPKGRPILGARPFSGPKTKLPIDMINRLQTLKIDQPASQKSIIRYGPEELKQLNPFSKGGKFYEFYR